MGIMGIMGTMGIINLNFPNFPSIPSIPNIPSIPSIPSLGPLGPLRQLGSLRGWVSCVVRSHLNGPKGPYCPKGLNLCFIISLSTPCHRFDIIKNFVYICSLYHKLTNDTY